MISQLSTNSPQDSSVDPFSFAGKLALVAGSGYGAFRTFQGAKPNLGRPFDTAYQGALARTLAVPTAGVEAAEQAVKFTHLGDITTSKAMPVGMSFSGAVESLTQATVGSAYQDEFLSQFRGLVQDIEGRGYGRNVRFEAVQSGDQLLEMRVIPREGTTFTVRPVTAEGDLYLGTGQPLRQAARLTINSETGQVSDISTAILKEQRARMGEILPSVQDVGLKATLRPADIERAGIDTSIFEDVAQGRPFSQGEFVQSPMSQLRRSEVLVDPFKKLNAYPGAQDAQFATLKRAVGEGWLLPGSAAMTSRGIGVLPTSIMAAVPGTDLSPVGKQFFRPSQFTEGGRRPSIQLPTDDLKQFKLGVVDPEVLAKFQVAAKAKGVNRYNFGELAEEELLMRRNAGINISNQIYQYEVGLQDKGAQISEQFDDVLNKLAEERNLSRNELLKAMEKPGGIQNLDIPAAGMPLGMTAEPVAGERKLVSVMNDLDQRIANIMITDKGTLKVAVKTEYQMREFQKVFGGFKGTVKAQTDVPMLLANLEYFQQTGRVGSLSEVQEMAQKFADVDFVVGEHPFGKFLKSDVGALTPKEAPALLQHSLLRAADAGEYGAEFLKGMGYSLDNTTGQWVPKESLTSQQLLQRFKSLGGAELFAQPAGIQTVETLLAPEFHRTQMGAGGRAGLSQRAFMNVMAYMPEEISDQLAGRLRYPLGARPQDQLTELLNYESLMNDKATQRLQLRDVEGLRQDIREGVLHADIQSRKGALELAGMEKGSKFAVLDLGQDVVPEGGGTPFRNIVISADEQLGAYIGGKPGTRGSALSDLDMATANVVNAALNKDTAALARAGAEYQRQLAVTTAGVEDKLFRGRFAGSMFGQAQSSLPGMAAMARGEAPVIAMHAQDIVRQAEDLGVDSKRALELAKSGDLWSMVSREPAEGVLRTLPAQVTIAEEMGARGYNKGVIYVGNQAQFRKGLGVDFDADQLSTILFTDDKARDTFNKFMVTGEGEVGAIGKEFLKTQKLFSELELKGRNNINLFADTNEAALKEFLLESGKTEKKLIGPLSVALQDVHTGYRDSMLANRETSNIAKAMKGEAFALFLAESSIKAKHRSVEALRNSEEILNILNNRDVKGLQGFMDKMAFGSSEIGAEIRAAEVISPQLAERAGGQQFAESYKSLTTNEALEDFFMTKERGRILREQDLVSDILGPKPGLFSRIGKTAGAFSEEVSPFLRKGLKNIGLFGILPAAGIGLAGTLMSEPEVLPVQMSAREHDKTTPATHSVTTDNQAWVQPKRERMRISGKVTDTPNPEQFSSYFGSSNLSMNINDNRFNMTQDYINRKVNRGF